MNAWLVSLVAILTLVTGCALVEKDNSNNDDDDLALTDDPLTLKRDSVLTKLGACFDQAKFDAMEMGEWRTTARTSSNNVNEVARWNEDANSCTGCNNMTCAACHSDVKGQFYDVVSNPLFAPDATFEQTKKPTQITSYFGWTTQGRAASSHVITNKSALTQKGAAYTHPMFVLTTTQESALNAFVTDTVSRFNAGKCGR
jgi:hypothetical protein